MTSTIDSPAGAGPTNTSPARAGPVRVTAWLDEPISRGLWLVKWLLVVPHLVVLAFLWAAFAVLTVVAFFAILITGRYPRSVFEFNLGVLRWSWRTAYYSYGALGTDHYPPFTLGAAPDYPATLDIAYPQHLTRGLVLVKWLLALPHLVIIAFFVGTGSYAAYSAAGSDGGNGSWASGGLIGLLVLIVGIALLFTGRYPRGLFDLLLGLHRWVLRVTAYTALMTDEYPPFRLDMGGSEPSAFAVAAPSTAPVTASGGHPAWSTGRIVAVVIGSVLLLSGIGAAIGGSAVLAADRGGRDASGFPLNGAGGVIISTVMWIAVVVAAWMVVAAVVGVLIGRMIRQRDRQVPDLPSEEPAPGAPTRVVGSDGSQLLPAVGRGRSRPS